MRPKLTVWATALLLTLLTKTRASAQAVIYGYTSGSFDLAASLVSGVTTTELDYASQEWYQARVMGRRRHTELPPRGGFR